MGALTGLFVWYIAGLALLWVCGATFGTAIALFGGIGSRTTSYAFWPTALGALGGAVGMIAGVLSAAIGPGQDDIPPAWLVAILSVMAIGGLCGLFAGFAESRSGPGLAAMRGRSARAVNRLASLRRDYLAAAGIANHKPAGIEADDICMLGNPDLCAATLDRFSAPDGRHEFRLFVANAAARPVFDQHGIGLERIRPGRGATYFVTHEGSDWFEASSASRSCHWYKRYFVRHASPDAASAVRAWQEVKAGAWQS